MKYKYIIVFQPTEGEASEPRECHPVYSDDLSVAVERESKEWFYTRRLEGKLTFMRADYTWLMGCDFDGSFTLTIEESHDGGASWHEYFVGTFSRANMCIDEDNRNAVLEGFSDSTYTAIENGRKDEYDLRKLIPDSEFKTVQGKIPPAMALVDYCSTNIPSSDIYCNGPIVAGGYKVATGWNEYRRVPAVDNLWRLKGIYVEAKVDGVGSLADGVYTGRLDYRLQHIDYPSGESLDHWLVCGDLFKYKGNGIFIRILPYVDDNWRMYYNLSVYTNGGTRLWFSSKLISNSDHSPSELNFEDKAIFYFHYIRAALLTDKNNGPRYPTVLNVGKYYEGQELFSNSGLEVQITRRTTEVPNGHRMVPGSGDYGGIPKYFAPPEDNAGWIALAENNWQYASMWYRIEPSVANGLLDPANVGTWSWQAFEIGTCLRYLLNRITGGKVVFVESTDCSRFLYDTVNPVAGGEPFRYLVTQKSNVMRPSDGGENAARCMVRLDWFLELLRNAFNCYWWLEPTDDGRYMFRVEHVEFFRRGYRYDGSLESQIDLTAMKPTRNFAGPDGTAAKRLSDQLNRYTFDMQDMVERYNFSWQGDGGSDDFKGHPMLFRAGWVEKNASESREVDNIFADLSWLMLNANTDTESSKNFDGLFIFAGYAAAMADRWTENSHSEEGGITIVSGFVGVSGVQVWMTVPEGETVTLRYRPAPGGDWRDIVYDGTGEPMCIVIDNIVSYAGIRLLYGPDATLHRIHGPAGNLFMIPNTRNLLRMDDDDAYLQNGPLSWPWLQCEYLHYDVPAAKWSYDSDDTETATWNGGGTIKMVRRQEVGVLPMPVRDDEDKRAVKGGLKTANGEWAVGLVETMTVNMGSRNAKLTVRYEIN